MQDSSWADRLELVGDDDRLVGSAGALPLRLLAERAGLRAGLSTAMTRRGFTPLYDRGQLLVDLAVTQLLGGEAISDFQGLRHLVPVIGPIPSTPTVWRALAEVGELQLARTAGHVLGAGIGGAVADATSDTVPYTALAVACAVTCTGLSVGMRRSRAVET